METRLGGHTEKLLSQRNVVRVRGISNFWSSVTLMYLKASATNPQYFCKSFVIERSRRELIRILPKADICEIFAYFLRTSFIGNIEVEYGGLRTTRIELCSAENVTTQGYFEFR